MATESYGKIYLLTNTVNKKKYVGQTTRLMSVRWTEHQSHARSTKGPLQNALRKYTPENFSIDVLCLCESQLELDEMEKYYVNIYNTWAPHGYNLKAGNGHGAWSDEIKSKISLARTGQKRGPVSEEVRERMSAAQRGKPKWLGKVHPRQGKHPSEESIQKRVDKTAKTYYFISPMGVRTTIRNMKKFCRENNLHNGLMFGVASGKRTHYKNWTLDSQGGTQSGKVAN